MAPWVVSLLELLATGSSSGWWGLACPAHCSSSGLLVLCIFAAGVSSGSLLTVFALRRQLFREVPFDWGPHPPVRRPGRPEVRLAGYLDE